jgi:hypothetical protein
MNPTKLKYLLVVALAVFALWGMGRCYHSELHLHSDYYVTRDGEFGEGWFFESNPGAVGIPQIDNLKSVAWNSRLIVIEQQFPGTDAPNVWWIVATAGDELMSGNDTILGPLTTTEKDAWLAAHPPAERLKRRRF